MTDRIERARGLLEELKAENARLRRQVDQIWRGTEDVVEALDAENERLREALGMAVYHAENLRRYIYREPVRDLAESGAGRAKAKRLLEAFDG